MQDLSKMLKVTLCSHFTAEETDTVTSRASKSHLTGRYEEKCPHQVSRDWKRPTTEEYQSPCRGYFYHTRCSMSGKDTGPEWGRGGIPPNIY